MDIRKKANAQTKKERLISEKKNKRKRKKKKDIGMKKEKKWKEVRETKERKTDFFWLQAYQPP